jgi:hypothetical protein
MEVRKMPKTKLWLYAVLFLSLSTFLNFCQAEEQIAITTYYPSPFGSYNTLYVTNSIGIGTTNPQASLDVDGDIKADSNTLSSCTWESLTCPGGKIVAGVRDTDGNGDIDGINCCEL